MRRLPVFCNLLFVLNSVAKFGLTESVSYNKCILLTTVAKHGYPAVCKQSNYVCSQVD